MTSLTITEYTDPGCPFAWSAEPARRRLDWLYGAQLRWEARMVGPGRQCRRLHQQGLYPRAPVELVPPTGRAAPHADGLLAPAPHGGDPARLPHGRRRPPPPPRAERPIPRPLRVLHFSGSLLDEPATLAAAAQQAGIALHDLEAWMASPRPRMRWPAI